jgi:colicin import membrane protein
VAYLLESLAGTMQSVTGSRSDSLESLKKRLEGVQGADTNNLLGVLAARDALIASKEEQAAKLEAAKAEKELKLQAAKDAKAAAKAEKDAAAKAEKDARAKEKADKDAKAKADKEAKDKADKEAKDKAEKDKALKIKGKAAVETAP